MEDIRQDIIDEYEANNLKASGNFERLAQVKRRGRSVVLSLPFYSQFISKFKGRKPGRGPGKRPPVNIIEQWVKSKGLLLRDALGRFSQRSDRNFKSAAYLISRKIGEQGTDIYLGKRQGIDIDKIIDNRLDYRGNELADRIMEDLRI